MDVSVIEGLITSLGFPIACVIALAWFAYYMVKSGREQHIKDMEKLQQESKERENKLSRAIEESRIINSKFADIIAKYDVKLDNIESDVKDIKQNITIIKTRTES